MSKVRYLVIALLCASPLFAQQIVTADNYLEQVSNRYAGFRDYEADIVIRTGSQEMRGKLSHKQPSFMRIDFSSPAEQVIVYQGETLTIYLPEYRATLNQDAGGGLNLASGTGLSMMRRNFAASYVTGPQAVEEDREKVVKLRLVSRYASQGFRELVLSVNQGTQLIKRIVGTQPSGAVVQFDFSNIKTNLGIPEQRFFYDSPADANVYNNFLFRDRD